MYLQAVLGRYQNAHCIMKANVSSANAWEMAPPEQKECMEKSRRVSAAAAYDLRSFVIWTAESTGIPRRSPDSPFPSVVVGNRYRLAIYHPVAVPI